MKRRICRLIGHHAPTTAVWNEGYYFGLCERCSEALIRSASHRRWKPVPQNYTVVWRPISAELRAFRQAVDVDRPLLMSEGRKRGIVLSNVQERARKARANRTSASVED
jgi:hypothetical protein